MTPKIDDNFILNKILEVFPLDLSLGPIHSAQIRDRLNDIGYDIDPNPLEEYLRKIEDDKHLRVDLIGKYLSDGKYYPKVAHYTLTFDGKKFIKSGGYRDVIQIPEQKSNPTNNIIINGNNNNLVNHSSNIEDNVFNSPLTQNTSNTKDAPITKNKTHWLQIVYWVVGIAGSAFVLYKAAAAFFK